MELHRIISYGLMTGGALASAKALLKRWQWEESNVLAAIMLDWDDVQAVATRAAAMSAETEPGERSVENLLSRFKEKGATHLSLPELTLNRLLQKGELSVTQGSSAGRIYLRAQDATMAELVATELQARLPQLQVNCSRSKNPLISFLGDLPTVAEIGLGFDPAQAELAHQVGLSPVARPIGYSWMQPDMIERSLDQAAALGAKIIAVQGNLVPGHEFRMQATLEAMQRNGLTYAYFSESRHQKGDWFLAKNLAPKGLVILAHEFEPSELLEDDWFTMSYRWANLAVEAGVRLCSVRFFRILHAADPLESLAYVEELANALRAVELVPGVAGDVDLTLFQPQRDTAALAWAGLSVAGAAGLAADLLPVPNPVKLLGVGATALTLASLPFLEKSKLEPGHAHDHDHHAHHPDHDHHHHHDDHEHHHDHPHEHAHHPHHDHGRDHGHQHDRIQATAYAPKGLALATTVAYPAAAAAINCANPVAALARALAISVTGATVLNATTVETDYVMGIETYRGYNLDWLIPLGLAAGSALLNPQNPTQTTSKSSLNSAPHHPKSIWRWLPLVGVVLMTLKNLKSDLTQDLLATFDREHRHAHTHHLSAFQRAVGDNKMALSPKPLRKWALLAPLGAVGAALLKRNGQEEMAVVALTAATAGQVATLAGFRNGQRALLKTVEGRARSWTMGAALAGVVWLLVWLFNKRK